MMKIGDCPRKDKCMTRQIDPAGIETQHLQKAVDWSGRKVLEIGCGDGRLARRLESLGALVTGLDNNPDLLKTAANCPEHAVRYCAGDGQWLPFAPQVFELVLFGWTL
jgi:ubiquinone/menaquinone biosynthesis C-methylase UbiE